MKELTFRIPDNKVAFLLELMQQLGIDVSENIEISDEQKKIVRERINNTEPEQIVSWEDARKQFSFKKS